MERRASVSIPCNSPRNPDWMFLSRVLGREVRPLPEWSDEKATTELRNLLFEARGAKGDALFAALLDLRTDESANARDLPGLRQRLGDRLFFQRKDSLGHMRQETRYNPAERYLSDLGQELVDQAISNERYALQSREREAMRIGGLPAPEVAPLKDTDHLPFGRFQDRPVREVPAAYLAWALDQPWVEKYPDFVAYMKVSAKAIDKELGAEDVRERLPDNDREKEAYEGQAPDPGSY